MSRLNHQHLKFASRIMIDECLSDLAGEVVATQYVQNAEVDQREEAVQSIETDLYRGELVLMHEMFKYIRSEAFDFVEGTGQTRPQQH